MGDTVTPISVNQFFEDIETMAETNLLASLAAAVPATSNEMFSSDCYLDKGGEVRPMLKVRGAWHGISPATLVLILQNPDVAMKAALAAVAKSKSPEEKKRLLAAAAIKAAKSKKTTNAAPADDLAAQLAALAAS